MRWKERERERHGKRGRGRDGAQGSFFSPLILDSCLMIGWNCTGINSQTKQAPCQQCGFLSILSFFSLWTLKNQIHKTCIWFAWQPTTLPLSPPALCAHSASPVARQGFVVGVTSSPEEGGCSVQQCCDLTRLGLLTQLHNTRLGY